MKFNIDELYKNESGIYIIRNSIDRRVYIGSTVKLSKRYREHKSRLKTGAHPIKTLLKFFQEYGLESLSFDLLEVCGRENLHEREQFYLDKLNPFGDNGFNVSKSSVTHFRERPSEDTKRKIYQTKIERGIYSNPEDRDRIKRERYLANLARQREYRKNNPKPRQGFSLEHRMNLSKSMKGNQNGKGAVFSEERKRKLSESNLDQRIVLQLDLHGNLVKEWKNQHEAYTSLGIDRRNFNAAVLGKQKSCRGYVWKFKS